jgi:hypothetical protein
MPPRGRYFNLQSTVPKAAMNEGNLVAIKLGGIAAAAAAVRTTTKDEEEDLSAANHHQYHTRGEWLDYFLQQHLELKFVHHLK